MDQHAAGGGAPLADDVGCRVRHGVLGDGRKVGHRLGSACCSAELVMPGGRCSGFVDAMTADMKPCVVYVMCPCGASPHVRTESGFVWFIMV